MISFLILIFTYLPSFLTHLVLISGIVGLIAAFFVSFVPFITTYKAIIKYVSVCLLVLGLFLEGGLAVNNDYLERAKEWNNRIQIAEKKADEVNDKIKIVYKDRIIRVKKVQIVYKDRIVKDAAEMDKKCEVIKAAVDILNDAAKEK